MITTDEYEIGRTKTIIGMAVDFTAMTRVFKKGSSLRIEGLIEGFLKELAGVGSQNQFDLLHNKFCQEFTATIQLSKINPDQVPNASYGQAAKVLDVALKACVDYCQLPDTVTSQRIKPFLHAGIDTPILEFLKKEEHLDITASSVKEIDRPTYQLLQAAVARQITVRFGGGIVPVMWDNIIWRRLNRQDVTDKTLKAAGAQTAG